MDVRTCSRPGCRRYADRTVTVDYGEQLLVVGPLQPASRRGAIEGSYDLCDPHAERAAGPAGWRVVRHEPGRAPR
ncbi:DUF3499 family protein [Agrococcus sediminis]|uniref:DUF3499 family protein n=1 Tax=Agrococcus sediminis TaxID=2599924 RepID=A0A5M8Q7M9_9MICO|nr:MULTISPECIES: DUF3499 family protein [Agrococcus]KAA6430830.1 DUF3499 family protein [Agrococcus sediminis]MDR7235045.1 hypothetical protein [Agrococcus sp. BE272]RWR24740.1 DUF3499 family protein [Agrococcus lahaulensis]UOW01159.1 DUF3499 domain-containing protein [Agrococcus sp. SCSIO52902]